jgi:hypothetical protein
MATYLSQECPLCGATAEYCWVDAHNRKYFHCPKCTYFQISRRAEEVLAQEPQQRRDIYASQARKAPENHLLVVRMPDHDFRQRSEDDLQASFVNKSELPLDCQ